MTEPVFTWTLPYASRRAPVLARNIVATSQPLAVQAGVHALERGGNAVDAALAAAIALVVVEPTNNGVGSDAFALVWDGSRLHALNGSGSSPAALDPAVFAGRRMPLLGWETVTVPGAVDVWVTLSGRFGRLPFADLFEPAVRYARDGFLVSPIVAEQWEMVAGMYGAPQFSAAFLPAGRAPRPGERFSLPDLARTLEEIAETRGESLYRGALAARITAHARACGAALGAEDLAAHHGEWVEALSTRYRGVDVHELPPNTQGVAASIALAILDRFDLASLAPDEAESLHLQIEATKLGLADARRFVGDPRTADVPLAWLLSEEHIRERAALIDARAARPMEQGGPPGGDTVYLCTADAGGMVVSYIQSNYFSFGSGVVVPGTGISLQNRGAAFRSEPGHPNSVGPRKRPFHTIMPAFLTQNGAPLMSFGVMGGPMQPQGHVQLVTRIVSHGQNPQAAIDAPRWHAFDGCDVGIEPGFAAGVLEGLAARGHQIRELSGPMFGGAQAVYRLHDGWLGASDWRKDGAAAGF